MSTLELSTSEIADLCDCVDDRIERLEVLRAEADNEDDRHYFGDTIADLRRLAVMLRAALR